MTKNALLDSISQTKQGWSGSGTVAARLLASGFNVNSLRTLGTLQKDEWKLLDDTVIQISRQRLRLVKDLMSRGLTMNLPNALGHTRVEWERVSDLGAAEIDMSGLTQTPNDRVIYDLVGVPVPIIHKDFQINIRALEASRNRGIPLDTTQVAVATRKVAEAAESLVLSGGFSAGTTNGVIYGYTNFPDRNTGSTTADWDAATGAQIIADVLAMINKAQADGFYGPYVLYVAGPSYVHLGDDYKAASDKSIISRILEIPDISAVMPSDNITDNGVVLLVQMTSETVDLIIGMQPTVVHWESQGGMVHNFKVMAIMVPRLKSDQGGRSGVVHYT